MPSGPGHHCIALAQRRRLDLIYRTVKGILTAGLKSAPLPSTADGSRLPALLRGPQELSGDLRNLNHPAHHGDQDLVEEGGR